jgi:NAD(P)-dependent dehydrogenase (short-subunit alcohol dehydrogenase family)
MQADAAVVITGASSGIGLDAALTLAARGWFVFAAVRSARDQQRLAALAGSQGLGENFCTLEIDVTDAQTVAQAAQYVAAQCARTGMRLCALINNAGVAGGGPIEEVSLALLRQIMEVNLLGAAAVTQAFLPQLRTNRGRIINISSVSGRAASPFLGPYAASKFALEALSDALRVELRPWGVRVILIEPGPIRTPIWAKSDAATSDDRATIGDHSPYAAHLPRVRSRIQRAGRDGLPPHRVSATIVTALTAPRPRARYLVSRHPLLFALFARLCPDGLRDWLFAYGLR